jgi:O-antigen/teichoic acid export membrane protein
MQRIITSSLKRIGIDKAILFTLLSRAVQAVGGLGSVVFIGIYLSGNERGYFYTFTSILGIQVFFELGLSGIITQYTAHEFAHLKWDNNLLVGDEHYKSRLSSLLHFFIKWFGVIAIFLFVFLLIAGHLFFSKYNQNDHVDWQYPWILLCLTTSLNLFIDPILAFKDGLGEVKDMAKIRFIQRSVNVILLFTFFALGFKLYSSALASLISILINYIQVLFSNRKIKLIAIWKQKGVSRINYMTEIFPFQWRIALSWISGYFIFQLFNPILFAYSGKVIAGQMGMSLQILNGISTLSMSWITTKVPVFSSLIAHKNFKELNILFNRTLKNLMLVNIFSILFFYSLLLVLNYSNNPFSLRFLPIIPMLLLCLVTIGNQLIFSWATLLRCHKQEAFLLNSIVIGIISAISTIYFGKYNGIIGVVGGYAFISIVISLPWAYYIFKDKIRLWHQEF